MALESFTLTHDGDAFTLKEWGITAATLRRGSLGATSKAEDALVIFMPAGVADAAGHYAEGTVFAAAEVRLGRFHEAMASLVRSRY